MQKSVNIRTGIGNIMNSNSQKETTTEPEPTIEIDGKKYTIAEYKELEEKAMKKLQRSMRAKGSNAK